MICVNKNLQNLKLILKIVEKYDNITSAQNKS